MHTSICLCFLNEKDFRFYEKYAKRSEFSICKGEFIKKNGMIHRNFFFCHGEGFPEKKNHDPSKEMQLHKVSWIIFHAFFTYK